MDVQPRRPHSHTSGQRCLARRVLDRQPCGRVDAVASRVGDALRLQRIHQLALLLFWLGRHEGLPTTAAWSCTAQRAVSCVHLACPSAVWLACGTGATAHSKHQELVLCRSNSHTTRPKFPRRCRLSRAPRCRYPTSPRLGLGASLRPNLDTHAAAKGI